ncbi:MAG: EamA family transporter [Candidatus Nanoarchaeia archaeon]
MLELWLYLAILSAILFALKDILSKKLLGRYDVSPSQLTFEQHFVAGIIILLFFLPFIDYTLFYQELYLFILKSIFLSFVSVLYLSLLKEFDISLVTPLLNLSPLFLLILSSLFLGEKISFLQMIGILVIMFGTYLLEITKHHHRAKIPHKLHIKHLLSKPPVFFFKITLALVCMSFVAILDKTIFNTGVNVYTNIYFTSLLIFIIISIYFVKQKCFINICKKSFQQPQTLSIGFISVLDMFAVLSAISQPGALVSLIIPLRRTSTLFSALFGGLLFHEQHLCKKLFAAGVMIGGVVLIVI